MHLETDPAVQQQRDELGLVPSALNLESQVLVLQQQLKESLEEKQRHAKEILNLKQNLFKEKQLREKWKRWRDEEKQSRDKWKQRLDKEKQPREKWKQQCDKEKQLYEERIFDLEQQHKWDTFEQKQRHDKEKQRYDRDTFDLKQKHEKEIFDLQQK